mgnify:CR=1 FL=1
MADSLGYSIFLDPKDTVRAWEARGELRPTVQWSEMVHQQHAASFTVAKIAKLDLLRQVQTSLDSVIRSGGTFEGWQKDLIPNLQRAGWWGAVNDKALTGTDETVIVNERRLRTIYDTNVRMSLSSGNWMRIQAQKDVLPYLRYLPSTSEHKRPLHKLWYGTLLPVDHPWWQTHFPPNGWFCKCHFEQVSERRMKRKGWSITPIGDIAGGPATIWHPASGGTITVPAGIDPGFGYNAGTAHLRTVAGKAADSIQQAVDAGLDTAARQTLRNIVDDVAFTQFVGLPDPKFPVMILDQPTADILGAKARVAVLSSDTMAKQTGKRADLPIDVYRQLPTLTDEPTIVARDGDQSLIFVKDDGKLWTVAVVKRTASGEGLFVTSVRQQYQNTLPRLLKGTEVIVDRR